MRRRQTGGWRMKDKVSWTPKDLDAALQAMGDHVGGARLVTRQLRYRLRHASNAGKAYLSSESEDSRTTDECRPAAGQHDLLARGQ